MQIRFSPPWEVQSNIDKAAGVKKLELLQASFFNWLYDCSQGFSSIILPESNPIAVYKAFMAPPVLPAKYYDQVLNLVESGTKDSLCDLYGESFDGRLRWVFSQRGDVIVASFAEAKPGQPGFTLSEDHAAQKMFCAELFKYMRTKTRVVDDTFSTSTQFAAHEVLTQLYACHLLNKVNLK
ncbi:hypothetical protein MLDJOKPK_00088 [Salmonella phage SPAsTU]|nr:hypothetical protein STsAS_057 [Salmonella phage STsAS]AWN09028.1 hypothetical protein MLDJOKPK_00088 [Salmonella phage SPAsTU]